MIFGKLTEKVVCVFNEHCSSSRGTLPRQRQRETLKLVSRTRSWALIVFMVRGLTDCDDGRCALIASALGPHRIGTDQAFKTLSFRKGSSLLSPPYQYGVPADSVTD